MKSLVILVLLFGVNNVLGRPNSIMFPTDPPEKHYETIDYRVNKNALSSRS